MGIFNRYMVVVLFLVAVVPGYVGAQTFGGEATYGGSSSNTTNTAVKPAVPEKSNTAQNQEEESSRILPPTEVFFIPEPKVSQEKRPTLDGVKRGPTSMRPIVSDDANAAKDDELIFLYYKDFQVDRMLSGRVSCSVTFVITTALSRRLNNLSVKLVWPKMSTSISFDDVVPNTETLYPYTLMGDGCFSMDKMPNIVVNRCRVKDLTQSQCASKIRWISKK